MKVKKIFAFLLVGALLIGTFGFTASARTLNPNSDDNTWFFLDVKKELGDKALQVYGIKYFISDPTEPSANGSIAIQSDSNGWNQTAFSFTEDGVRDQVSRIEEKPFFTQDDYNSAEGVCKIFIAFWWGDSEVTGYEYYDKDGKKLTASASSGGGGSASKTGDNNLLVMFGVLFAVSAAGLVVLRKRQKSC